MRQTMGLFVYTVSGTFCIFLMGVAFTTAFEGTSLTGITSHSLFGWVNSEYLGLLLYMALAVGVIGVSAYNYAIKHVPPLAYAVFKLLDPPFSAFVAFLVGMDGFPSAFTVLGGIITLVGVFTVQVNLCESAEKRKHAFLPPCVRSSLYSSSVFISLFFFPRVYFLFFQRSTGCKRGRNTKKESLHS